MRGRRTCSPAMPCHSSVKSIQGWESGAWDHSMSALAGTCATGRGLPTHVPHLGSRPADGCATSFRIALTRSFFRQAAEPKQPRPQQSATATQDQCLPESRAVAAGTGVTRRQGLRRVCRKRCCRGSVDSRFRVGWHFLFAMLIAWGVS